MSSIFLFLFYLPFCQNNNNDTIINNKGSGISSFFCLSEMKYVTCKGHNVSAIISNHNFSKKKKNTSMKKPKIIDKKQRHWTEIALRLPLIL